MTDDVQDVERVLRTVLDQPDIDTLLILSGRRRTQPGEVSPVVDVSRIARLYDSLRRFMGDEHADTYLTLLGYRPDRWVVPAER